MKFVQAKSKRSLTIMFEKNQVSQTYLKDKRKSTILNNIQTVNSKHVLQLQVEVRTQFSCLMRDDYQHFWLAHFRFGLKMCDHLTTPVFSPSDLITVIQPCA